MNDVSRLSIPPVQPELPIRPRPFRAGPFGVLDIGTTKVTCLIGRLEGDGALRIMGHGWQRGRGVRGGGIIDIEEAERAIRAAVGQAEDLADLRLRQVTVNLSCGMPESQLVKVQWPMGGRVVGEADLRRVMQEGRSRAAADGREVIHALPLGFSIDQLEGVDDPRGLHCDLLTARMHVVDAQTSALRNLAATIARCDLDLAELVSAPIAAALSVLVDDERDLGATVIDMGGGTTGIAVLTDGNVVYTGQLPVGGQHVTNDIAHGLRTTVSAAERLKTLYGHAEFGPHDEQELLTVPVVGEDDHEYRKVPRSELVSIIRPRLEEIFEMVRDRLETNGLAQAAGNRTVLTGGASQLVGVQDMAARILGSQVRIGKPYSVRGLPDQAAMPPFATAAGLLAWAAGDGRNLAELDLNTEKPGGAFRRFVNFLKERV